MRADVSTFTVCAAGEPNVRTGGSKAPRILTDRDGGHDQRVAVEQRRRLGAHVAAEVVQQQLLLLGEAGRGLGHGGGDGSGLLVGHVESGGDLAKGVNGWVD